MLPTFLKTEPKQELKASPFSPPLGVCGSSCGRCQADRPAGCTNCPLLTRPFIHTGIIMKYSTVKRKSDRRHSFTHATITDGHNAGNYSQSCKIALLGINEMVISFDQLLYPLKELQFQDQSRLYTSSRIFQCTFDSCFSSFLLLSHSKETTTVLQTMRCILQDFSFALCIFILTS